MVFGRPFEVWAPASPGSRPLKLPTLVAGNCDLRSATSRLASVPSTGPVCWVDPSQTPEETALKSPGGASVVSALLGSPPGPTYTWQVYLTRADTWPLTAIDDWL